MPLRNARSPRRQFVADQSSDPATITVRARQEAVLAQVRAERLLRYPAVTGANFDEARAWQEARIAELGDGDLFWSNDDIPIAVIEELLMELAEFKARLPADLPRKD